MGVVFSCAGERLFGGVAGLALELDLIGGAEGFFVYPDVGEHLPAVAVHETEDSESGFIHGRCTQEATSAHGR